jgi:hypothetical protein
MAVNMKLCNYNWNLMNLSLLSSFDTMFGQTSPENKRQYIGISSEKLKSVTSFILDYVNWKAKFRGQWCIATPVYLFLIADETVSIIFTGW